MDLDIIPAQQFLRVPDTIRRTLTQWKTTKLSFVPWWGIMSSSLWLSFSLVLFPQTQLSLEALKRTTIGREWWIVGHSCQGGLNHILLGVEDSWSRDTQPRFTALLGKLLKYNLTARVQQNFSYKMECMLEIHDWEGIGTYHCNGSPNPPSCGVYLWCGTPWESVWFKGPMDIGDWQTTSHLEPNKFRT